MCTSHDTHAHVLCHPRLFACDSSLYMIHIELRFYLFLLSITVCAKKELTYSLTLIRRVSRERKGRRATERKGWLAAFVCFFFFLNLNVMFVRLCPTLSWTGWARRSGTSCCTCTTLQWPRCRWNPMWYTMALRARGRARVKCKTKMLCSRCGLRRRARRWRSSWTSHAEATSSWSPWEQVGCVLATLLTTKNREPCHTVLSPCHWLTALPSRTCFCQDVCSIGLCAVRVSSCGRVLVLCCWLRSRSPISHVIGRSQRHMPLDRERNITSCHGGGSHVGFQFQ